MSFARYEAAEHQINEGLIRLGLSIARGEAKPRDPNARMSTMRHFLDDCGNPQSGIPAIHVAGTSGKGSVSAAVAGMLTEAGLKVGLHVSPYLQSATEKIWMEEALICSDGFADLVDWVMPHAVPRVHPDTPASIHGMASVAIAFEGFRRENVDVMVYEAGCGGRYDLTSFMDTTVSVVTNVGMDHVISLGPTLEDIAWHKAGVARQGAPMVTGATGRPFEIIADECKKVGAEVVAVSPKTDAWAHNHALAAEAARQFAAIAGLSLSQNQIEKGAVRVPLAGRFETMPEDRTRVVIDGAHNAEKLRVAVEAALDPSPPGPKVGVLGFLGTKAKTEVTKPVRAGFDKIIATEPSVYGKTSYPAAETAKLLAEHGLAPEAIPDANRALDRAISLAGPEGTVFVSGSFYLVGEIRERWFKKEDIVKQRTSWPNAS